MVNPPQTVISMNVWLHSQDCYVAAVQ